MVIATVQEVKTTREHPVPVPGTSGHLGMYVPSTIYFFILSLHLLLSVLAISSSRIIPLPPARLPSSQPVKPPGPHNFCKSSSHRQRHCRAYTGSRLPWIASTTLSPMTGKNLNPCPLPPVATKRDLCRGWYVIKKSPVGLCERMCVVSCCNSRVAGATQKRQGGKKLTYRNTSIVLCV